MTKIIIIVFAIVVLGVVGFMIYKNNAAQNNIVGSALSEMQARVIAEKSCIKGGESLAPGYYNENSKTWWFDANLNATQPGCNPACVVSEETKTAEINWRCTGLIPPQESADESILRLFIQKYPRYAQTLSITIEKKSKITSVAVSALNRVRQAEFSLRLM